MMYESSFPTSQQTRYISIRETSTFVLNDTSLCTPKILWITYFHFMDNSQSILMLKQQGLTLHVHNTGITKQPMYVKRNMRIVRVIIVAVEKSNKYYIFWVCVCSLSYPTWNVDAMWLSVRICRIFPYFLIKGTIFAKKKVTGREMCGSFFSTSFVWNVPRSVSNWARYYKYECWLSCKVPVMLIDFNGTVIYWTHVWQILKHQISC
jgi:hypothetical protein